MDEEAKGKIAAPPDADANNKQEANQSNQVKAYCLAFLASLLFGNGNYWVSYLGQRKKVDFRWIYCEFIAPPIIWLIYHIGKWISLNNQRAKEGKEKVGFFDKSTSVYFK